MVTITWTLHNYILQWIQRNNIALYTTHSALWPSDQASQSIWQMPSLNLSQDTGYPNWGYCDFSVPARGLPPAFAWRGKIQIWDLQNAMHSDTQTTKTFSTKMVWITWFDMYLSAGSRLNLTAQPFHWCPSRTVKQIVIIIHCSTWSYTIIHLLINLMVSDDYILNTVCSPIFSFFKPKFQKLNVFFILYRQDKHKILFCWAPWLC
jgi:hypothetical protein